MGTLAAAPVLFRAGIATAVGVAAGGLIGCGSTQALTSNGNVALKQHCD